MSTTAELLLKELEDSAQELLTVGEHPGQCTNANQLKVAAKIPPCSKCLTVNKAKEERFWQALSQFKMLRDVFSENKYLGG
jgi:hypothetical protein